MFEYSLGNPCAQLMDDGPTLDNHHKCLPIGMELIDPHLEQNYAICLGMMRIGPQERQFRMDISIYMYMYIHINMYIHMLCVCVALFYYTDIGESLRSRGQFLTAVDLGWPDPHPAP